MEDESGNPRNCSKKPCPNDLNKFNSLFCPIHYFVVQKLNDTTYYFVVQNLITMFNILAYKIQ